MLNTHILEGERRTCNQERRGVGEGEGGGKEEGSRGGGGGRGIGQSGRGGEGREGSIVPVVSAWGCQC